MTDATREAVWLVECPKYHPSAYFALCDCGCGRHHWTPDVHKATKFPTKEIAEETRGGDINCIAVEHIFGLTLPASAPQEPVVDDDAELRHKLSLIGLEYASKGLADQAKTIERAIDRLQAKAPDR